MIDQKIIDKTNKLCEGSFKCLSISTVEYSCGHPYTISSKHVEWVADHCGGKLTKEAIRAMEKEGVHCAHSGCIYPYDEHKSEKAMFLQLLKNLENKEAADILYQVRKQILEPNNITGICFVDTPEHYRIAKPKGGDNDKEQESPG